MKTKVVLVAVFMIAFGFFVSRHEGHENPGAVQAKAKPPQGLPESLPPAPISHPVQAGSSLVELRALLDRFSDEELSQLIARSDEEIRRRIVSDPRGLRRTDAEAVELSLELNREAAARVLLIDRKLDALRRK